jgi:hypothetical protein
MGKMNFQVNDLVRLPNLGLCRVTKYLPQEVEGFDLFVRDARGVAWSAWSSDAVKEHNCSKEWVSRRKRWLFTKLITRRTLGCRRN